MTIPVFRNRTTVHLFDLGMNITGDDIVAQIRAGRETTSALIADWVVEVTDAATGQGTITLDNSDSVITAETGWMDIIRVTGGEPLAVMDQPLQVEFIDLPSVVPE